MKVHYLAVALCLLALSGCDVVPKAEAEAQSKAARGQAGGGLTAVDVAIAGTGLLQEKIEFVGNTEPVRAVSVRSQVEGRLLNLNADLGDKVTRGQILAQLDDALLQTAVTEAQAELASRKSEVARAQTQVSNARAKAEEARLEFQQAQRDAARRTQLFQQGAIAKQDAELAETAARTAQQTLRAAEEQIRTEQQAVAAAQARVAAQQAAIAQSLERKSYSLISSPINGVVTQKITEPGNLVQPGGEILKLGDFSRVKVKVPVSELELSDVRIGQAVQVRLDAFENQTFTGQVTSINPAADATARQIPVEVTIPNSNGRIGSGLFARVSFATTEAPRVIIPQTALQEAGEKRSQEAGVRSPESPSPKTQTPEPSVVFVVTGEGKEAKVAARQVTVGERVSGKVEVLSGLQPGERFVTRSGKPLKDGEQVRVSVLSQTNRQNQQNQQKGQQ